MKRLLTAVCISAALGAPAVQASTLSIDDSTETLHLYVDQPGNTTTSGTPGAGNAIDLTQPSDPANGISSLTYNSATELLEFTFANHLPWNTNVGFYRYYTEADGTISDLFVIQGQGGTNPDHVQFSSADNLTGNLPLDLFNQGILELFVNSSNWTNIGTVLETGDYQLAFNTGPDQYFIRSDIPEPASLALLGLGLAGLGFSRRRKLA